MKKNTRHVLEILACIFGAVYSGIAVHAQQYPSKPVRLIVGFAPGGAADILARVLGSKLSATWGQTVIVDNRPGAGSTLGAEIAANAQPDGYTLHFISSSYAASAGLYSKLKYDPIRSFSSVSLVASAPQVILANPSVQATSLSDVIALAKASPGKLNYGSAGNGSTTHLAGELLWNMAGVKLTHVPYKGGALALIDTIAGSIQFSFLSMPPALPHIRAGRVKAVAVTSVKRSRYLPDVQTASESVPGYEASNWYAMLAPVGLPKSVADRVYTGVRRALKDSTVIKSIESVGAEPSGSTPEELSQYLRAEIAKWTEAIKISGVSLK